MEKYCAAGQAAADNIKWRMRIACRMNKVTDTHSEHVILTFFPTAKTFMGKLLNLTFIRT